MHRPCSFAAIAALVLATSPARADPPDRGAALVAGAVVLVVGFAVGGMLVASGDGSDKQANAGWLTMQSTFALAPLAAHGVAGHWARGVAWSAAPAAMAGGSAGLFAFDQGTIFHGSLPEQRWLWSFFGVGLSSSIAGLVDVAVGEDHAAVALVPSIAPGCLGLAVEGAL